MALLTTEFRITKQTRLRVSVRRGKDNEKNERKAVAMALFVMNADGTDVTQLTFTGVNAEAAVR